MHGADPETMAIFGGCHIDPTHKGASQSALTRKTTKACHRLQRCVRLFQDPACCLNARRFDIVPESYAEVPLKDAGEVPTAHAYVGGKRLCATSNSLSINTFFRASAPFSTIA
jgi:hypothetical protein